MRNSEPICVDIKIEHRYLDMRPHPEDRAETHDRIEKLFDEKNRRCKCGRLNS